MHGVSALPPDSPQVAPPQPPQHKPSPNNNILPPKPAHLAAQAAAAASSFRQSKPPMPSPPLSSPPSSKIDQEVRYYLQFKYILQQNTVQYSTKYWVCCLKQKTHTHFTFFATYHPPPPPLLLYIPISFTYFIFL